MNNRVLGLVIATAMILIPTVAFAASPAAAAVNGTAASAANAFSVDFTGGTIVEATYPGTADVEKVRKALESAGFHEPTVQAFGNAHDISARLAPDPKCANHLAQRYSPGCSA